MITLKYLHKIAAASFCIGCCLVNTLYLCYCIPVMPNIHLFFNDKIKRNGIIAQKDLSHKKVSGLAPVDRVNQSSKAFNSKSSYLDGC